MWGGYEGVDRPVMLAVSYLGLVSLGLVVLGLMRFVRGQRVQLRGEEREAQELARAEPWCSRTLTSTERSWR